MRYKITIEYDGTNLLGWQEQLDGPSAQNFLQQALNCFTPLSEEISQPYPDMSLREGFADEAYAVSKQRSCRAPSPRYHSSQMADTNCHSSESWNPEDYKEEDASTGKRSQKTNADYDNDFSESYESDSTERRPAAYIEVREDASTGKRSQKTNKIIVQGAGRTDAGVHATAQTAHFDLKENLEEWKLREALNARLRNMEAPVSVLRVEKVSDDFNARFSAKGRGYLYRILNRRAPAVLEKNRVWWVPVPLDIEKMREAASYLIGHHDFSSFRAAACQAKSPVKTLDKLDIEVHGEEIHFIVEARSFLHHQVRNMVGTLKMVGDGHLQPEDIKQILEAKQRAAAGITAPACGLYLTKVVY